MTSLLPPAGCLYRPHPARFIGCMGAPTLVIDDDPEQRRLRQGMSAGPAPRRVTRQPGFIFASRRESTGRFPGSGVPASAFPMKAVELQPLFETIQRSAGNR